MFASERDRNRFLLIFPSNLLWAPNESVLGNAHSLHVHSIEAHMQIEPHDSCTAGVKKGGTPG